MLPIPRRHAHFLFGVIQSGLTSLISAGIASVALLETERFFSHWITSSLIAWLTMIPFVLLAAPAIRRMADWLTRE
jgi:hypothetical protein